MKEKTNKDKFLSLVSSDDNEIFHKIKERIKNRNMLRYSQLIAYVILSKMDDLNISISDVAEKMKISINEVEKIVSGREDLKLSVLVKLEETFNISLLNLKY